MALGDEEKKQRGSSIFGLLCGSINIKKGSCIGDSSVIENDEGVEGATFPSTCPVEEQTPPAPAIPSPVLMSKKLAEEAIAKRNIKFRHRPEDADSSSNNKAEETTAIRSSPTTDPKLSSQNRGPRHKRRQAPAPPAVPTA